MAKPTTDRKAADVESLILLDDEQWNVLVAKRNPAFSGRVFCYIHNPSRA